MINHESNGMIKEIREILKEYEYKEDIFTEDSYEVQKLKYILNNKLTEIEKRVIVLYAELQSQRKLAKVLSISTSSANNLIREIRKKVLEYYDN